MNNNNIENFENSLYKVYTTEDEQNISFKTVRLRDNTDNEEVRLYLEYNGKLIKGLQVPLSRLNDKMREVINHGAMITYVDRANLLRKVYQLYKNIPVIDKVDGLGWQYDKDGEVVGFAGSEFISVNGETKIYDIEESLPTVKGEVDMDMLNTYMNKHVVREIAILYNLTAPIAGLLEQCFILSLWDDSSTGKTTLAKLAISQTCSDRYDKLCKTLNTTDNAAEKGLEGNKGLGVLLDDTSLTNKGFDWNRYIYRLSTGKSKDRLGKERKLEQGERFYSTITFTTENSILSKVDANREGNNGRIIEIPLKKGIIYDSDIECRRMERYYQKNYGITLPLLIKKIMEQGSENILNKVYKEEEKLRFANSNAEAVVKRHFLEIAALRVTAELANQYLGYKFNIDSIADFLISNISESLYDTRVMQTGTIVLEKIYGELYKTANFEKCKTIDGVEYYPVRNEELKKLVNSSAKGMTFAEVKHVLWKNNLLYKQGDNYSVVQNIDGKSVRCLWIRKEEQHG